MSAPQPPRRLYRLRGSAVLGGVCSGIAAYFGVDPILTRIAAVLLILATGGAALFVYLALIFVVPAARTDEERAAAHGQPFNAQSIVARGKRRAQKP